MKILKLLAFTALLLPIGIGFLGTLPDGRLPWDFRCFVAASRALALGVNPYAMDPALLPETAGLQGPTEPNLNAPLSLLFLAPLSGADPLTASTVLYLLSWLALVAILVLLSRRHPISPLLVAWVLAMSGIWQTFMLGQVYLLMALLVVLAYRRPGLIGFLAALKPNLGLWPLFLLLAGHRRQAIIALATAAGLGILPALVYGPEVYLQWLAASSAITRPLTTGHNASIWGVAARHGLPIAGVVGSVALILGTAALVYRYRPDDALTAELALLVGIIASPLGWPGYSVLLFPAFLSRQQWPAPLLVAASLLVWPDVPLSQLAGSFGLNSGDVYLLALLAFLGAAIRATCLSAVPNMHGQDVDLARPEQISTRLPAGNTIGIWRH